MKQRPLRVRLVCHYSLLSRLLTFSPFLPPRLHLGPHPHSPSYRRKTEQLDYYLFFSHPVVGVVVKAGLARRQTVKSRARPSAILSVITPIRKMYNMVVHKARLLQTPSTLFWAHPKPALKCSQQPRMETNGMYRTIRVDLRCLRVVAVPSIVSYGYFSYSHYLSFHFLWKSLINFLASRLSQKSQYAT